MVADAYVIFFRPEVEGDIRGLGRGAQQKILRAIKQRLTQSPEKYGKPLGGSLRGLRRIRTGHYRIAYQVQKRKVLVWAVLHRRTIYAEMEKRCRE
ncbi:MAG: type II toxin-antitoxin system RelE/ParE family toxin [Elusimicrobiota bacterium]